MYIYIHGFCYRFCHFNKSFISRQTDRGIEIDNTCLVDIYRTYEVIVNVHDLFVLY